MATPFGAWGGMSNNVGPGFSDFLKKKGYSNETNILSILPDLDPVQQVQLDIALNMNGINAFPNGGNLLYDNAQDKKILIPIFKGKIRNPRIIQQAIQLVYKSKASHKNRAANQLTGSDEWNDVWIKVYDQWIKRLHHILGEINEA